MGKPKTPSNNKSRTCLAQMIEPDTGGRSRTRLMWHAWLCGYCTLNFSCNASMSSFTRWISCVWYSRIAPRMCGRTKSALKREKMRNISLALRAVPSWSRRRAVICVSTRSIRSSYLWAYFKYRIKLQCYIIELREIMRILSSRQKFTVTSKTNRSLD